MANINDVAQLANVSKSTISYVFSNKKYVSPTIRQKVLDACDELNYHPNFFASNVLSNNSKIIGLFLEPNNNNFYPFYSELIQACITELNKHGMLLITYFSVHQDELTNLLHSGRAPIMGAIILTPHIIDERIDMFETDNLPFVLIGRPQRDKRNLYNVDVDNAALTKKIFQYVYACGHRDILFINALPELTIAQDREKTLSGFLDTHRDVCVKIRHVADEPGEAYIALRDGLDRETCVITASDLMAADVYKYCGDNGLTVGKDLSVAAFGGGANAEGLAPKLTYARQNYLEIGRIAIELMTRLLVSDDPYEGKTVLMESDLIIRDSVADITRDSAFGEANNIPIASN
ncbi:MAG: LacI family transcriptional regulator [Clostridiales bacterium]|nr:LacI family transcriptional regulator [Clostridiales bacterium]